ncbi:hypothetical protein C0995_002469 [Termitomyces sp. Mi166|nr:hypothetical protein C0995_002469 [Termitomyces sp. Mi166\
MRSYRFLTPSHRLPSTAVGRTDRHIITAGPRTTTFVDSRVRVRDISAMFLLSPLTPSASGGSLARPPSHGTTSTSPSLPSPPDPVRSHNISNPCRRCHSPTGGPPRFPRYHRGLTNVAFVGLRGRYSEDQARNSRIDGNIRINATGQAPVLFQMPDLIDTAMLDDAKTRTGFDGHEYELVFSDEFEVDGRSFYPGEDPFWEAVDLWYGATGDIEWYDPQQIDHQAQRQPRYYARFGRHTPAWAHAGFDGIVYGCAESWAQLLERDAAELE